MKKRLPNTTFYLDTNDFDFVSTPTETNIEVSDRFVTCATRNGGGQDQTIKGIKTFEDNVSILSNLAVNNNLTVSNNLDLEKSLVFDNLSERGFTLNNQVDHLSGIAVLSNGSVDTENYINTYSKNTSDENKSCVSEILLKSNVIKTQPAVPYLSPTYTYSPEIRLSLKEGTGSLSEINYISLKKDDESPYEGIVEVSSDLFVKKDVVFDRKKIPDLGNDIRKADISSGTYSATDYLLMRIGEDSNQTSHKRSYIQLSREMTSSSDIVKSRIGIEGYHSTSYIDVISEDSTSRTFDGIEISTSTNGYIKLDTSIVPSNVTKYLGTETQPFGEIHSLSIHGLLPNPEDLVGNVLPTGSIVLVYVLVNYDKTFSVSTGGVFNSSDSEIYAIYEAEGFLGYNSNQTFSGRFIALHKVSATSGSQGGGSRNGCIVLAMKKKN